MEGVTIKKILELTDISFRSENRQILKNISLTVNTGDLITINGPSGSGKSTLLKIIANILPKSSGNISFNSQPIENYIPTDYRKDVSYFFQNPVLFGETVQDNLTFPYDIRHLPFDQERAIFLLKSVNLNRDDLARTIDSLSGGEKQRVAFVRNILFQPKIILLDEVTSALDQENREIIHKIILELNKKQMTTILWITHNQEEFDSSDKRITITNGEIVGDGNE